MNSRVFKGLVMKSLKKRKEINPRYFACTLKHLPSNLLLKIIMTEILLHLKAVRGVWYVEVAEKVEYDEASNSPGIPE